MWNLKKKGYNELLYRTETDSHTLKNIWLPKETGSGGEGWPGDLGWKCCKTGCDDGFFCSFCFVFVFVFLPFLGPLSQHMEVSRLGVKSEL